jgi:Putative  PD-(D/E)XK family member, (DUF4420)
MMPDPTRRLTTPTLMRHWDTGVLIDIPIAGHPTLRLRINPHAGELTLRAPAPETAQLPQQELTNVTASLITEAGTTYLDISTTDRRLVVDGYGMLMSIADRIQLAGADPLDAFVETLEVWRSIMAERYRMSPTAEIGLFGELLVLKALISTGAAAPTAWRGGLGEEHDFGLPDVDVEIKTTTGEHRHHWIHGITQLVNTGATPLWLVSLQITRAGDGSGHTLPCLIDLVLAVADEAMRGPIAKNLHEVGWREETRDLFDERWRQRSAPLALPVDDSLPRITPEVLKRADLDTSSLLGVTYEIAVDGKTPPEPLPPTLATILAAMNGAPRE